LTETLDRVIPVKRKSQFFQFKTSISLAL